MKRIYSVLIIFVLIFSLSSCKSDRKIEDVLPVFYLDVINQSEKYSVKIESLDAYSKNEWQFFDVDIKKTYKGKNLEYELIYIYQMGFLESFFNINDGEEYFNYDYSRFLNAESTGRHLVISEEDYNEQIKIAYDKRALEEK